MHDQNLSKPVHKCETMCMGCINILTLHIYKLFLMSLWPCDCSPAGIRAEKGKTTGDIQTGSEMRNGVHRMHNILTLHVYKMFLMSLWPCDCSPARIRAKKLETSKLVQKCETECIECIIYSPCTSMGRF